MDKKNKITVLVTLPYDFDQTEKDALGYHLIEWLDECEIMQCIVDYKFRWRDDIK